MFARANDKQLTYRAGHHAVAVLAFVILLTFGGSCSTLHEPLPPLPPTPPPYVQVPHPQGLDLGDLYVVFTHRDAPSPKDLKNCDSDFRELQKRTTVRSEIEQGALELVRMDPVKLHWCYYSKLMEIEQEIKNAPYLEDRRDIILNTYSFLTPIARAFMSEYNDSRYMRWAVIRYRQLSETVFYRRLEVAPNAAAELVQAENPFGLAREPAVSEGGILEKYGIVKPKPPVDVVSDVASPKAQVVGSTEPLESADAVEGAEPVREPASDPALPVQAPTAPAL